MEEKKDELEKLTGDNNKLEKEKQQMKEEMETRDKDLKEKKDELEKIKPAASTSIRPFKNSSSSDSQETLRDINVFIDPYSRYICLTNMSDQDKPLGGRQLKVQINNSEPITYTFKPSMKLKAGDNVTFCHPDYLVLPGDLVWEDLKSWKSGDRVKASLQ
ncbi:lamin-A-like [Mugil cephalus]|uniref:lamin-A-like n=1 Tax=Mugil cephalus TaxID=48193 RepID=UPI001FB6BFD6|nr:lamin-A-like [Mugil cephalus]